MITLLCIWLTRAVLYPWQCYQTMNTFYPCRLENDLHGSGNSCTQISIAMEFEHDLFGIEREKAIKRSGVRKIFTPHQPIQNIELLMGREKEVRSLIEYLNTPGQHAILFGDRGVGKSSLANITADLLLSNLGIGDVIKKRCDSTDTFITIVGEVLDKVGIDVSLLERTSTGQRGINIKTLTTSQSNKNKYKGYDIHANSPSWVANKISALNGIFLIDEVDAIVNTDDKKKLAELVKHLSDMSSNLKILIVGIAETANELIAGHQSVNRCLKETHLSRMSEVELKSIILTGQSKLELSFNDKAIQRIVSVSSGYPHFTHLLALKAAEDAIVDERTSISTKDVENATKRAVEDAEGSLKRAYDEAIRSAHSQNYERIILAAALCGVEEIRAIDLRNKYSELFNQTISQNSLNNYFKKLVSTDGNKILRRIAKGVYRFSDPRMPSYVRIAQSHLS